MKESKGKQLSLIDESMNYEVKDSGNDKIFLKTVEEVLHESMLPYSEHVILDRALPRVEDGLKPVQRRILYTMLDLGLTPDKPFLKSARIVGDCLGKYHPHGDTSVYDAMVRMAQPFNMGATLVEGHGNFGSVDGDCAAAMRYTEAKMTPLALQMLKDLEKNTVSWSLNYDDSLKEPDMLPAGYPNLLVNGAMGIAVGLATNIPTHNLNEVIDATVLRIEKPKSTLDDIMKVLPAPDFPTGGYIIAGDELRQAYETGKGKIIIRAKVNIENDGDKKVIIVTEFPYQVNKAVCLQKIVELKDDKGKVNLADIQEVRDESDRNGTRAVIKLKKDANVEAILNYLYKYSNLQVAYHINMVAIADGRPKQMGLLEILDYYISYRQGVILKRTKYDLEIAKERAHILEGLLIAIKNIDKIIKIIKNSANTTIAKTNLRQAFNLSDRQAQAILDMRLARLTNLEENKIIEELKDLREKIDLYTKIVNSSSMQLKVVKDELLGVKREFKTPRKCALKTEEDTFVEEENISIIRDVVVALGANQTIKSMPIKNFNMAQKSFNNNSTMNEVHSKLLTVTTDKTLYMFSNFGNVFKIIVDEIEEKKWKDKGTPISTLVELGKGEKIIDIDVFNFNQKNQVLYFFTKNGMVKCSNITEYNVAKNKFDAISLRDDDEIVSIHRGSSEYDRMIIVTKLGNVLSADISDITPVGRVALGVKAINLNDDDSVVFASLATDEGEIITITNKAYAKRTIIPTIDMLPRYRKGVKITPLGKENGTEIVFASIVKIPYYIVIKDINDMIISKYSEDLVISQRTNGGKSVVRSKAGLMVDGVFKFVVNLANDKT